MSNATFRTTMDTAALVISGLTILLIGFTMVSMYTTMENDFYLNIILPLLFSFIIIIPFIYSPSGYSCTSNELLIHRPAGKITIDYREILNIRSAESDEIRRLVRLWGSGGLFGYFGKFYDSKHRNFKMYGRRRKNKVLVFTKTGLVVLMPDEVEGFMRCVRKGMIK